MTLLQPTDVPSRDGINAAITSEIGEHTDTADPTGPHYQSAWTTFTKVAPAASMANIVLQYRITGKMIEWRTSGTTAAAIAVPASGDIVNQNITTSVPVNLRPSLGNWTWLLSVVSKAAYIALTPGGTLTIFAVEGWGYTTITGATVNTGTIAAGTDILGQSPAFVLP